MSTEGTIKTNNGQEWDWYYDGDEYVAEHQSVTGSRQEYTFKTYRHMKKFLTSIGRYNREEMDYSTEEDI